MPGVSWSERQPTDWLASNGRWYADSKYPRGWATSALPPAPGHGGVGSILRGFVGTASPKISSERKSTIGASRNDAEFSPGWTVSSDAPESDSAPSQAHREPSSSVVPTGRRVAEATITEPPPRTAMTPEFPPPPGRLGAPPQPSPPLPAAPVKRNTPYVPPPSPNADAGSFDVVAGDLGKVLGSAKRRIEKAINDAAADS